MKRSAEQAELSRDAPESKRHKGIDMVAFLKSADGKNILEDFKNQFQREPTVDEMLEVVPEPSYDDGFCFPMYFASISIYFFSFCFKSVTPTSWVFMVNSGSNFTNFCPSGVL